MPRITEVLPVKSFYRPEEPILIEVSIENNDAGPTDGTLAIRVLHLGTTITCTDRPLSIGAGQCCTAVVEFAVPTDAQRGYGIEAEIRDESGQAISTGYGAFDVLDRWSQAPRYGFLSTFSPDCTSEAMAASVRSLRRFHLNVVQFYDWMWRHYRLLPPTDVFTDALGRELSLAVVRQAIRAIQGIGSAAFAYGAVYGAEPEYADEHPELVLHDRAGAPISLAELFYIMDIAPDSPWTATMIGEFASAIRELDFDGIHMDQYGFPKEIAWNGARQERDLSLDFPPMIDAARAAVVAEKPDAGVIFNLVDNWPVETVAPTTQDAIYIEVWPPYDTYLDLFQLIDQAKRLGNGQQVILAAYLTPFLDAPHAPESEAAALLATAVIASSGGFHLLLGETNGVLCDPYYPKYGTMRDDFVPRLAAYYDHLVRYEEWLTTGDVVAWDVQIGGDAISMQPEPGKIWAIPRRAGARRIIHLIDLRDQTDIRWNAPRASWAQDPEQPITLHITGAEPVGAARSLSPELNHGRLMPCDVREDQRSTTIQLLIAGPWTSVILDPQEEK